ncbi:unnamed protein product, partial [Choristocarpus tenellus]
CRGRYTYIYTTVCKYIIMPLFTRILFFVGNSSRSVCRLKLCRAYVCSPFGRVMTQQLLAVFFYGHLLSSSEAGTRGNKSCDRPMVELFTLSLTSYLNTSK